MQALRAHWNDVYRRSKHDGILHYALTLAPTKLQQTVVYQPASNECRYSSCKSISELVCKSEARYYLSERAFGRMMQPRSSKVAQTRPGSHGVPHKDYWAIPVSTCSMRSRVAGPADSMLTR